MALVADIVSYGARRPRGFRPPRRLPVRPNPFEERRRRLRRIGWTVLAAGLASACLLYWIRTRDREPSMDELMPGYSQANRRQMGILYGTTGVIIEGWIEDLREPETQAVLLAGLSAVIAIGCFYSASRPDED